MRIKILPGNSVDEPTLNDMWELYAPHHNVDRAEFQARVFDAIDFIALYYTTAGQLAGFLGFRFKKLTLHSQKVVGAFYMGLAFIHPRHRGSSVIPFTVIRFLLKFKLRNPLIPVYFWTDAISYKPYLVFSRNLKTYFPNRHMTSPNEIIEIRDQLGKEYYGDGYNAENGTVLKKQNRLKAGVAEINPTQLTDPDIQFYANQNPGYAQGNGLILICPGTIRNIWYFGRKKLRKILPARSFWDKRKTYQLNPKSGT